MFPCSDITYKERLLSEKKSTVKRLGRAGEVLGRAFDFLMIFFLSFHRCSSRTQGREIGQDPGLEGAWQTLSRGLIATDDGIPVGALARGALNSRFHGNWLVPVE